MSLRAGTLRHRITLLATPEAQDAYGEPVPGTPAAVGTFWGRVEALSGREAAVAMQVRATLTHKITLRSVGVAIDPRLHHVSWKGRTFQLVSALDPSGVGAEWTLMAEERI